MQTDDRGFNEHGRREPGRRVYPPLGRCPIAGGDNQAQRGAEPGYVGGIEVGMTGDELASALYAEQGYLIAGTWEPRRIGELIEDNIPKYGDCSPTKTPLRVIGDAT